MDFKIPFFDEKIDTSDPSGSAEGFGAAVVGGVLLLAVVGTAEYLYQRAKNAAGVDSHSNIPGV